MKRLCIVFIVTMFSPSLFAQINLVPNSSFEDTVGGAPCYGPIEVVKNWFNPQGATPDLYTFFPGYCTGTSSLNNGNGFQLARTGNAYAGIYGYISPTREYIAIKLNDTLELGTCYYVEFYVSLANPCMYAIDNLGCYFTHDTSGYKAIYTNIPISPQVINQSGNFLSDTMNWEKVSGSYTAVGGEVFIIIGNFFDDQNTVLDTVYASSNWQAAYYYIDDVRVLPCDSLTGIFSDELLKEIKIYPIPASESVFLYLADDDIKEKIAIFDLNGKEYTSLVSIAINLGKCKINISKLLNGVYFISVPNKTMGKRNVKFIK